MQIENTNSSSFLWEIKWTKIHLLTLTFIVLCNQKVVLSMVQITYWCKQRSKLIIIILIIISLIMISFIYQFLLVSDFISTMRALDCFWLRFYLFTTFSFCHVYTCHLYLVDDIEFISFLDETDHNAIFCNPEDTEKLVINHVFRLLTIYRRIIKTILRNCHSYD